MMKTVFAGLMVLVTTSTSFAQQIAIKDKGKVFSMLVKGNQEEALSNIYSKYNLDPSLEYLVVHTNEHPALVCAATSLLVKNNNFSDDVNIDFDMEKKNLTYLIPNSKEAKTAYFSMTCRDFDYVTSSDEGRESRSSAFNRSFDAVIISRHTITKKENVQLLDIGQLNFKLHFKK